MRSLLSVFLLALVVQLLANAPAQAIDTAKYELGTGDRVRIVVFGHGDLTTDAEVDGAGQITMPLIGLVPAGGNTIFELQDVIRARLDAQFVVDPQVSVLIVAYRPIYVLGEVTNPGSYSFRSGLTVRQAVAMAGGYSRRARSSSMLVFRDTSEGRTEVEAQEDTPLEPGDTLEITRRLF